MKIFTNSVNKVLGGISQQVNQLANFIIAQKKHKLAVANINVEPINPNPQANAIKTKFINTYNLGLLKDGQPKGIFNNIKTFKDFKKHFSQLIDQLIQLINCEKPEIILVNGTYFASWALLKAAQNTNKPVLLSYSGIISQELQGIKNPLKSVLLRMERDFDHQDIHYIFPSVLTKTTVEKNFKHPCSNSIIIPNCIPDEFFNWAQRLKKEETIGFVGRWAKIKNFSYLFKLSTLLKKSKRLIEFQVISDASHRSIQKNNFPANFKILLPKPVSGLKSFYQKIGVLISPSYFETYGNVPQEALASGTWAFVNKNMGIAEIYRRLGLDQLIIDFKDIEKSWFRISQKIGQTVPVKIRTGLYQELNREKIWTQKFNFMQAVA